MVDAIFCRKSKMTMSGNFKRQQQKRGKKLKSIQILSCPANNATKSEKLKKRGILGLLWKCKICTLKFLKTENCI